MKAYFIFSNNAYFLQLVPTISLSIMISSPFIISCLQKSSQLYCYYFTPFSITYYSFCRSSAKSFTCFIFSLVAYFPILNIITYCSIQSFCTTKDIPCRQFFIAAEAAMENKIIDCYTYWNHCYYRYYKILSLFWESSSFHFPNIIAPVVYATMATRYLLLVLLLDQLIFVHIELQPLF